MSFEKFIKHINESIKINEENEKHQQEAAFKVFDAILNKYKSRINPKDIHHDSRPDWKERYVYIKADNGEDYARIYLRYNFPNAKLDIDKGFQSGNSKTVFTERFEDSSKLKNTQAFSNKLFSVIDKIISSPKKKKLKTVPNEYYFYFTHEDYKSPGISSEDPRLDEEYEDMDFYVEKITAPYTLLSMTDEQINIEEEASSEEELLKLLNGSSSFKENWWVDDSGKVKLEPITKEILIDIIQDSYLDKDSGIGLFYIGPNGTIIANAGNAY